MYHIESADSFDSWLKKLNDHRAKNKILARIRMASLGNLGDHHTVGNKISEMRIDYGPGYRLYYTIKELQLVLLLAGGAKSSQKRDISMALKIMKTWEESNEK